MIDEIRDLIKKGKSHNLFKVAQLLVSFINSTGVDEIQKIAPEIKKWLVEDLKHIYVPPTPYIPGTFRVPGHGLDESLWVLENQGVADKLRKCGLLEEIVESLIKAGYYTEKLKNL